jgi:hypothetical protein
MDRIKSNIVIIFMKKDGQFFIYAFNNKVVILQR